MARTPSQLREYLNEQEARLNASFSLIRKSTDENFWKFLEVTADELQGVENSEAVVALELAARLNPAKFNDSASNIVQKNLENTRILESLRWQWVN